VERERVEEGRLGRRCYGESKHIESGRRRKKDTKKEVGYKKRKGSRAQEWEKLDLGKDAYGRVSL